MNFLRTVRAVLGPPLILLLASTAQAQPAPTGQPPGPAPEPAPAGLGYAPQSGAYAVPGYAAPVYAYGQPGYAVPGYGPPGYAVPGYAAPVYAYGPPRPGWPGYGTQDALLPPPVRRSVPMMVTGIVLSGLGGLALLGGAALSVTPVATCGVCDPSYQPPAHVAGIGFMIGGLAALGAGIPLSVVGAMKVPARGDATALPTPSPTLRLGLGTVGAAFTF